jgi:DNA repair protein RecO (recombination protein O)
MPAEESSAAIVLRARDYSESDRIVTLLTRHYGKLSGMAKGAKASRKRFERKLEPFSHVMLYFRRRPHGQLVFVTRAEASPDLAPFAIEDDLTKIALGSYMLELSDAFTSEEAEATGAYSLLADALTALGGGASTALRQKFELRLLKWAGYGLEFSRCRHCASPVSSELLAAYFIIARGGIICARCRPMVPEGAVRMAGASALILAQLAEAAFRDNGIVPAADGAPAIARFIASVLDRRLRSAPFLDSMLPFTDSH